MEKRNEEYEKKFRAYLFSLDFETHKKICENINVKPNIPNNKNKMEKERYTITINIDEEHTPEEALREVLRIVEAGCTSGIDPTFDIIKDE